MAQNITKKFEKEKPSNVSSSSYEKPEIDIEVSESSKENLIEKEGDSFEKSGEEKDSIKKRGELTKSTATKGKISIASPNIERQKQIDKILSEGLDDVFLNLSQADQDQFREVGEKTVLQINELLSQAKVKIKKIINLIKKWLRIIPKINPYFLEQEAKIKADKIVKLKK